MLQKGRCGQNGAWLPVARLHYGFHGNGKFCIASINSDNKRQRLLLSGFPLLLRNGRWHRRRKSAREEREISSGLFYRDWSSVVKEVGQMMHERRNTGGMEGGSKGQRIKKEKSCQKPRPLRRAPSRRRSSHLRGTWFCRRAAAGRCPVLTK